MPKLSSVEQEVRDFFAKMTTQIETTEDHAGFVHATAVCLGASLPLMSNGAKLDSLTSLVCNIVKENVENTKNDPLGQLVRDIKGIGR